jgi:Tfp pilus assembly protein PilF
MTVIGTQILYHFLKPEWIVYKAAEIKYREKDNEQAALLYEKSFTMGLKYPLGLLKLGHVYLEMEQFSKAQKVYEIYLTEKPNDVQALRDYAAILTANGEFEAAAKVYQRIISQPSQ